MKIFAVVLLIALVLPGFILGLLYAPWFFLLMGLAVIVPLFYIGRGVSDRRS